MSPTAGARISVEELLASVTDLPVLPQIAIKLFGEMSSPTVTAARLAEFIKKDPVLASAVLRVANSAIYGARTEISDLAFAIARVGLTQIRNLLLAIVLRSKMVDPKVYGSSGAALMDHGLAVAFGAGLVADAAGVEGGEAFLCGLLHDFGKLALIKALRERAQIKDADLPPALSAYVQERHGEAGALLAKSWGLPELVQVVARYHHALDAAPEEHGPMVASVAFANALATQLGLGKPEEPGLDLLRHPSTQMLGLSGEKVEDLTGYLPGLFKTARSALFS